MFFFFLVNKQNCQELPLTPWITTDRPSPYAQLSWAESYQPSSPCFGNQSVATTAVWLFHILQDHSEEIPLHLQKTTATTTRLKSWLLLQKALLPSCHPRQLDDSTQGKTSLGELYFFSTLKVFINIVKSHRAGWQAHGKICYMKSTHLPEPEQELQITATLTNS
jgi:hypothetical protein